MAWIWHQGWGMMKTGMVLVMLATGCAAAEDMRVHVVSDDPATAEVGCRAVDAWHALGFSCDQAGAEVHVVPVAGLQNARRILGHADFETRSIDVDASLAGNQLQHVLTHEMGHMLLGQLHVTVPGAIAVMTPTPSSGVWLLTPTQADYDLACDEIGVCVTAGSDVIP